MKASIKLSSRPTHEFWELAVLHEDDQFLALEKPSDLAVWPDRRQPDRPSLMGLLREGLQSDAPWAVARRLRYLAPAHRLEAQATGVLLLTRSRAVLEALLRQFASAPPRLRYIALVQGSPAQDTFQVEVPLSPDPTSPGASRIDLRRGRKALTRFCVLERFATHTLLEGEPGNGRADQVRLHLGTWDLPLSGDTQNGGKPILLSRLKPGYRFKQDREERPLLGRLGLHLEEVALQHPATREPLDLRVPLPKDLSVAVKYLRRYAGVPAPVAP